MKNSTDLEMVAEFERLFPGCRVTGDERAFFAFVHIARNAGVGYGWMRQAIGVAWKMADPVSYIDDERVRELAHINVATVGDVARTTSSLDYPGATATGSGAVACGGTAVARRGAVYDNHLGCGGPIVATFDPDAPGTEQCAWCGIYGSPLGRVPS